jgi:hypothetical protein
MDHISNDVVAAPRPPISPLTLAFILILIALWGSTALQVGSH